jgi:uncharacterized protein YbcI
VSKSISAGIHQPLEEEFTQSIAALLRTYLGPETLDTQVYFVEDMIVIRSQGMLTPAETALAEHPSGRELIKKTRNQLFEITRPYIEKVVRELLGHDPLTLYSHLNLETGEQLVLVLVGSI